MNIFFLMNGNIFNYTLASEQYMLGENCGWFGSDCSPYYAYAIPPNPPSAIPPPAPSATTTPEEPIFVQSYINAYNTAFNQETSSYNLNYQKALYNYNRFTYSDVNSNFVPGTFGYDEEYNNSEETFYINYLTDNLDNYMETPYLFISAGSGGGSGFMYLDWIIVTYGVPYVVSIS